MHTTAPHPAYNPYETAVPVADVSFEQFSPDRRILGDASLELLVTGSKMSFDDEAAIQRWANTAPPTPEEVGIMNNPAQIAALHDKTARMIEAHSALYIDRTRVPHAFDPVLQAARQSHKTKLAQDNGRALQHSIELWRAGRNQEANGPYGLSSTASYEGWVLPSSQGNIDVMMRFGTKLPGVRPRISYQNGMGENYVHWVTAPLASQQLSGRSPAFSRRIYLNPSVSAQTEVFVDLMQRLEVAELVVAGKMADRATELAFHSAEAPQPGREPSLRTDGIVLAMTNTPLDKEHARRALGPLFNDKTDENLTNADVALRIVEAHYKTHVDVLQGRPTPKLAQRIGEGTAVSDEPAVDNESFTGHRAKVLAATMHEVRSVLQITRGEPLNPEQRQRLRAVYDSVWNRRATEAHINPDNFAWNR